MAPMAEYWQLLSILADIDRLIAFRTDHELEGWHEAGHVITEFREDPTRRRTLGSRSPDFLTLPPGQAATHRHRRGRRTCAYRRARKLAPRKCWIGAPRISSFPDHIIALGFADKSLGDDLRENRRLMSDGEFEISNQLAHPEAMRFLGTLTDSVGASVTLDEGKLYGTVLNPWDTSALWVYDAGGGFMGTAKRKPRLSRLSDAGTICGRGEISTPMKHALGEREANIAQFVAPLRDRHPDIVRHIHELQEHNARVERGEAITIEEKTAKRELAATARTLTDADRDAVLGVAAGVSPAEQPDEFSADEVSRYFGGNDQPNEEGENTWQTIATETP